MGRQSQDDEDAGALPKIVTILTIEIDISILTDKAMTSFEQPQNLQVTHLIIQIAFYNYNNNFKVEAYHQRRFEQLLRQ